MLSVKELRDLRGLQIEFNIRRSQVLDEIERRKYYEGFSVGKERKMFQEELKDLELVYKKALVQILKQEEEVLPSLLYYMEEFLNLKKQSEGIREKIDALFAKQGRGNEEEGDEDE